MSDTAATASMVITDSTQLSLSPLSISSKSGDICKGSDFTESKRDHSHQVSMKESFTLHSSSLRFKKLECQKSHLEMLIKVLETLNYKEILSIIEAWHANITSERYMQSVNEEQRKQEFARSYIENCRQYLQKHLGAKSTNTRVLTRITQQFPEEELVKLTHRLHYLIKTCKSKDLDIVRIFNNDDEVLACASVANWYTDYVIENFAGK